MCRPDITFPFQKLNLGNFKMNTVTQNHSDSLFYKIKDENGNTRGYMLGVYELPDGYESNESIKPKCFTDLILKKMAKTSIFITGNYWANNRRYEKSPFYQLLKVAKLFNKKIEVLENTEYFLSISKIKENGENLIKEYLSSIKIKEKDKTFINDYISHKTLYNNIRPEIEMDSYLSLFRKKIESFRQDLFEKELIPEIRIDNMIEKEGNDKPLTGSMKLSLIERLFSQHLALIGERIDNLIKENEKEKLMIIVNEIDITENNYVKLLLQGFSNDEIPENLGLKAFLIKKGWCVERINKTVLIF